MSSNKRLNRKKVLDVCPKCGYDNSKTRFNTCPNKIEIGIGLTERCRTNLKIKNNNQNGNERHKKRILNVNNVLLAFIVFSP